MDIVPPTDSLPLRVLVPESGLEPTIVYDESTALVMAVIDCGGVRRLNMAWDAPGIYILLQRRDQDGLFGAYVGKAPAGLKNRVGQHVTDKDDWEVALLICRDTTHGFNSTQAGWLEGRIYQLLKDAVNARVSNQQIPTDNTLAPYERTMLENCVIPISRVLRMLGFDPSTAEIESTRSSSSSAGGKTARYFGVTVTTLLGEGYLTAGEHVVSLMAAWPGEAVIELSGRMRLLSDGKIYDSPSAAANATGASSNGWSFWGVERGAERIPLSTVRETYLEQRSTVLEIPEV